MSCPTHRAGLNVTATARTDIPETVRPVTDQDVRNLIVKALTEASGVTQWIDDRPQPLFMEAQGMERITVWDDVDTDGDEGPGRDFALVLVPLAWCDAHHRNFIARDRLCAECVTEQTEGDE